MSRDDKNNPKTLKFLSQEDHIEFQERLLEFTQADFCHHSYSQFSKISVSKELQIVSYISPDDVKRYLKELSGRLKARKKESSYYVTPSDLWRERDISQDIDAIIVGASQELAKSLSESSRIFVAAVDTDPTKCYLEQSKYGQDSQVISILTSEIFDGAIEMPFSIKKGQYSINDEKYSDDIREKLRFLAEDNLSGDNPISFISIPLSYYISQSSQETDFLALEMAWIGNNSTPYPINIRKEAIEEVIRVCHKFAPCIVHKLIDKHHICNYGEMHRALDLKGRFRKALDIVLEGGTKERMIANIIERCGDVNSYGTATEYITGISSALKNYISSKSSDDLLESLKNPYRLEYSIIEKLLLVRSDNVNKALNAHMDSQKELIEGKMLKRIKNKRAENKSIYELEKYREDISPERLHFALREIFPPEVSGQTHTQE